MQDAKNNNMLINIGLMQKVAVMHLWQPGQLVEAFPSVDSENPEASPRKTRNSDSDSSFWQLRLSRHCFQAVFVSRSQL
jgi:hypothetical protein